MHLRAPDLLLVSFIAVLCSSCVLCDHRVNTDNVIINSVLETQWRDAAVEVENEAHISRTLHGSVNRGDTRTMLVFGDSISDNGIIWRRTNKTFPPSPPYKSGRWTNGRVVVEHLAEKLKLSLVNLAEGAASACEKYRRPESTFTLSVERVVNLTVDYGPPGHKRINWKKTAVVFIAGTNDILSLLANPSTISLPVLASGVATCLSTSVEKVLGAGAKKVLIVKVGPANLSPRLQAAGAGAVTLAKAAEVAINAQLDAVGATLKAKYPKAKIQVASIYDLFADIATSPTTYRLLNTTSPCLSCSNQLAAGEATCITTANQTLLNACLAPGSDKRVWWDTIHFTTAVHKILANSLFSQVTSTGGIFSKR